MTQTDNCCSPWDVNLVSHFVHPDNVKAYCTDVPTCGSAQQVIEYVMRTEAGAVFKENPSNGDPEYFRSIRKGTEVWLRGMLRKASAGTYDSAAGVESMWADFKMLIHNAKKRNQPEYWEWRAAEMLEKELRAVKRAFVLGAGSVDEVKATIPKVKPRPGNSKRARPSAFHPERTPKRSVIVDAKSRRGTLRRAAAAAAILSMASEVGSVELHFSSPESSREEEDAGLPSSVEG
jgi:hypothetical protein